VADILAGLTVAAYLVPQVMAYAEVAGLPPVVGCGPPSDRSRSTPLLGSSRQLSIGPKSTTAMARVKQDLRDDLIRAGLVDRVGVDLIFPTLPTAVAAYLDWYQSARTRTRWNPPKDCWPA